MFDKNQTYEQFLTDYYTAGPKGYLQTIGAPSKVAGDVAKLLTHDESNYYESEFAKGVQLWLTANTEIYKLFDKKPITAVGDSFKYTSAFGLDTTAQNPAGTASIFGSPSEPTVSTITGIVGGIERVILNRTLHSMIKEKVPGAHGGSDWSWISQEIAPKALANKMDNWLGGYGAGSVHGVDTPAGSNIECIDRMISTTAESGGTTYVSAATDGDIFWDGVGTGLKLDRSSTDNVFDSNVTLPSTDYVAAGYAYNMMDEIDDLMTTCKKYSKNKRYIGLTTDKTLNLIENELSPGQRYDETTTVQSSLGGISTRAGKEGGFEVAALKSCGVKFPVFTSNALPTKNSVYGTATETAGHFYLIDLDDMYIRVDMPTTYLETGFGNEMLAVNTFTSRALLFTVAQLVCTNPKPHGAIKWIAQ